MISMTISERKLMRTHPQVAPINQSSQQTRESVKRHTNKQRVGCNNYGGDMGYTQNSARAHGKLLVTDSLTPTPLACGVQGTTDREEEWTYAEALPHDLTIPHNDSRQLVPLNRRSGG